jgi:hypothetical protein
LIQVNGLQIKKWLTITVATVPGAISMAHFADKLDWQTVDRVESAVLLSFVGSGLALCVLGAAVYDIGRAFSVW